MRRTSIAWLLALASAGCGDDDPGTTGSGSETEGTSTGSSATSPTTSISESATMTGTGTDDASATDTDTGTDTSVDSSSESSGAPNEPPEAVDDQYVVYLSEMPLAVDAVAGVLANDVDPDGDELTVSAFDDPSTLGLTVDVAEDGSFSYSAAKGAWWGGPDAFGYTISDGRGGEATATVELLVVPDLVPLGQVRAGVGGFAIDGEQNDDGAGFSVAIAGDVDGDGLSDVIVGAPGSAGAAYVVFGKTDGDHVDLANLTNGMGGGFAIVAEADGDNMGFAVAAAGDVNDDGLADVIVSAPESDASASNAGRSYVVFGKADADPVDLADVAGGVGGFAIDGLAVSDRSGNSVTGLGDMNADGFDDVAIGVDEADPNGASSGRVYVVFGKANGDLVALSAIAMDIGGFTIDGEAAGDEAGRTVAGIGDVSGDGVPDLLLGAPFNDAAGASAGRAYVVFGKSDGTTVQLSSVAAGMGGFALDGEAAGDFAGSSVGPAGDIDGDGLADFIVAAPRNDGAGMDTGRAYVVFGQAEGSIVDLGEVASGAGGFAIDAPSSPTNPLLSVWGGADVDGDAVPDLVVGATPPSAGRSYAVHGKVDGTPVHASELVQGMGGFAMDGEQNQDVAGFSVGLGGDVNGDGFADVVVGAYGFPGGQARGRVYVVFGSPSALD